MALAKASAAFDVTLGSLSQEAIGLSIAHYLSLKGFCTVGLGLDTANLEDARKDISKIDADGHLQEPSYLYLEGFLGNTGSARVAELELAGAPEHLNSRVRPGPRLGELDAQMTSTVEMVYPYLGFALANRTAALVHEAGHTDGKAEVIDDEAAKWLGIFAHHRLMVIVFLGPSDGYLEIHPFDDIDSPASKVVGKPGSMVILRPDLLSHTFSAARGEAYCLSCFYSKDARPRKRVNDDGELLTPCAAALDQWAMNRVKEVKECYEEDDPNRPRLPRHWEMISNHTGFVGQHMAIRSAVTRVPSTWDDETFGSIGMAGVDFAVEVPLVRWNIDDIYEADPSEDPELWMRGKTSCRHGGFQEGVELFDNKAFRLSPAETSGMDPGHRGLLEGAQECLYKAEFKDKDINNSRGAVFVGGQCQSSEWCTAPKSDTGGGVCGGGNSVACGRISFTLGMKGPCSSLDCAAASGLLALSECSMMMTYRGKWDPPPFAVVGTYQVNLSPSRWVQFGAMQLQCPEGRCFSFDASANGFVRGETLTTVCVKRLVEMVDGNPVLNEAELDKNLGTLASNAINQNGRRATMMTPDGAAEQECMVMACRNAYISPLDVDAVEMHASGSILHDAVEAASTARAFRPDGMIGLEETPPLGMLSMKTGTTDFYESSGLVTVVRVMRAMKFGVMMPVQHLRIINPHIDLFCCERKAFIGDNILEHRLTSAYSGVTSKSFTGTNVHMLCYGQVDEEKHPPMPAATIERQRIAYWPEGGGKLERDQEPRLGYSIAGSWSRFEPQDMKSEGAGVYSFTVTLGENRWEHFQIWLDGNKGRALHPGEMKASKGMTVYGPEESLLFNTWLLDGRPLSLYKTGPVAADGPVEVSTLDTGFVGDMYEVRLRVAGKYRTVEWEKLDEKANPRAVPKGKYYVVGTWTDMAFEEMVVEDADQGLFSLEVTLADYGGDFLVVRDQDWMQVFHPGYAGQEEALGPDPMQISGAAWSIGGAPGDRVKITFQRLIDETGKGLQQASWTKIGTGPLSEDALALKRRPALHLVGSWDNFVMALKMHWTGSHYQLFVELGALETVSFRLMQDANVNKSFFPSIEDAGTGSKYSIVGPRAAKAEARWTIGQEDWSGRKDSAEKGKRYEIRVRVEDDGTPASVDWRPTSGDAPLEDALCRGFFAYGL